MDVSLANNKELECITLENFCNILKELKDKNGHSYSYIRIAKICLTSTKTLERYRAKNQGYQLSVPIYESLFTLLKDNYNNNDLSIEDYLISSFQLPDKYKYFGYESLKNIIIKVLRNEISSKDAVFFDMEPLIASRLYSDKKLKTICLSFYTGWNWLKDKSKMNLLDMLENLKIKIRIIVNDKVTIEEIAESMTDPQSQKYYLGYNQGIIQWNSISSKNDNIELRISKLPLLRKICILEYDDGSCEALLGNYIYKLYTNANVEQTFITTDNKWLKIYKNEFEYLWENGLTYKSWASTYDATVEENNLPNTEYIMIHFKSKKIYGISSLQLNINHKVVLNYHLSSRFSSKLDSMTPECTYHGTSKTMGNHIFLTLTNSQGFDPLCIQLSNPLKESGVCYLGIMTKLNYLSPVAYKCIVIPKDIFNAINEDQINNLLTEYTQLSKHTAISIDSKELEFLYKLNISV